MYRKSVIFLCPSYREIVWKGWLLLLLVITHHFHVITLRPRVWKLTGRESKYCGLGDSIATISQEEGILGCFVFPPWMEMKSYSKLSWILPVCWPVPLCPVSNLMAVNHCGLLGGYSLLPSIFLDRWLVHPQKSMSQGNSLFSRSYPLGRLAVVTWECSFEDVGQGQWHFYSPSCTELWDPEYWFPYYCFENNLWSEKMRKKDYEIKWIGPVLNLPLQN